MSQKVPTLPPLRTWQFYHACKQILGETFLQKLYSRGRRQIYRWSANPDFTDDHKRNPLDRLRLLLERLAEVGREDVALSAVEMLADAIGYEVCRNGGPVEPDQPTIEAECLDDYPALVEFHQEIKGGADEVMARHLWWKAKRELDETYQRYAQGEEKP